MDGITVDDLDAESFKIFRREALRSHRMSQEELDVPNEELLQIRIEDEQMIISNRCILPQGWTVEKFMQPHDSIPYNPDIAGVFYRAGYIEHWGRGIEKICNACKEAGAELPRYEVLGNGIRVFFKALEEARIEDKATSKPPKCQNDALDDALERAIVKVVKSEPAISQTALAERLSISRRTVQRAMEDMQAKGILKRQGGKRYGYWEILTR